MLALDAVHEIAVAAGIAGYLVACGWVAVRSLRGDR